MCFKKKQQIQINVRPDARFIRRSALNAWYADGKFLSVIWADGTRERIQLESREEAEMYAKALFLCDERDVVAIEETSAYKRIANPNELQ